MHYKRPSRIRQDPAKILFHKLLTKCTPLGKGMCINEKPDLTDMQAGLPVPTKTRLIPQGPVNRRK